MSYSVNLYLDNAISPKKLEELKGLGDRELTIQTNKEIRETLKQIFVYLRYGGKTIKVYVERKCTQQEWDADQQNVSHRYYKRGAAELNTYLSNVKNGTAKLHEANLGKGILTSKDHVKALIYELNDKAPGNLVGSDFWKALDEYIKQSAYTKAGTTVTIYRSLKKHLQAFSEARRFPITFDRITAQFDDKLRGYFLSDLKLTNNTIAKYIRNLKTFMSWAQEHGYHSQLDYLRFKSREKDKEVYALTKDELMTIYNAEIPDGRLARVRDVFCFACFTGVRYSDVADMQREDIHDDLLHVTVRKTKETLKIPIISFAQNILERYSEDNKPLPVISDQKTNAYLKELGKMLGIDAKVRRVYHRGSEVIEEWVPKYEVLTFHLARKTFVTLSLILGMSEAAVKQISGHKKDASFRKYVYFADEVKKDAMHKAWNPSKLQ